MSNFECGLMCLVLTFSGKIAIFNNVLLNIVLKFGLRKSSLPQHAASYSVRRLKTGIFRILMKTLGPTAGILITDMKVGFVGNSAPGPYRPRA